MIDPCIATHKGRIVKSTGDGFLAEFPSAVAAARCMIEVQTALATRNVDLPPDQRIQFRIGINLGDIIIEQDDIFGDGVNIAARLEATAEPGGICISSKVYDEISEKLDIVCEDMGSQQLKNIARPVRVYRVDLSNLRPASALLATPPLALPDRSSEGSQGAAVTVGTWRVILLAFQSHERRTWGAAVIALLCIGWGAAYLIWRAPTPAEKQAHGGAVTEAPPLKLRPVFKDCDVCPEMVALPAGEFMMGSPEDEADRVKVEGPPRRIVIAKPFAIGKFEITVDQFGAFVNKWPRRSANRPIHAKSPPGTTSPLLTGLYRLRRPSVALVSK